ncbi:MAG: YggS family pyridoxal phosphate-dependent enzyme [Chitinophagaceae bacterium]
MPVNKEAYHQLKTESDSKAVTLVAVSKTKPVEDILALYELGHRDFGENYVQEMLDKASRLPKDIRWHFIGHLQSNKIKLIVPFVQLIHGVDSLKLLKAIDKEGNKQGRVIDCLLQVHIADEETKFGFDETELQEAINEAAGLENIRIKGLMGMASFTDDFKKVRKEFRRLKELFDAYPNLQTLSMGMSSDYRIALEEGTTMLRIGSLLLGERSPQG